MWCEKIIGMNDYEGKICYMYILPSGEIALQVPFLDNKEHQLTTYMDVNGFYQKED